MARRFWPQPLLTETQMTETVFHDISQKRQGFAKITKTTEQEKEANSRINQPSPPPPPTIQESTELETVWLQQPSKSQTFSHNFSQKLHITWKRFEIVPYRSLSWMKTASDKRRKLLVCPQSVTREGPQEEESEERRSPRSKYLVVAGGKTFKKVRAQKRHETNNKRSFLWNPCSLIGQAVTTSGILLLLLFPQSLTDRYAVSREELTTRNPNHCFWKTECDENAWEKESRGCTKGRGRRWCPQTNRIVLRSVGDGGRPLYPRADFVRVCPGSKRGPKSRWFEKHLEVRINHASSYYSSEGIKPSF